MWISHVDPQSGSREIKDQNVTGEEFGVRQSMKLY